MLGVYRLNETQMSTDVVERAWDYITGWLVSNEHRFSPIAVPFYGKIGESAGKRCVDYFVIPQYLDEAIEEAGFNVKKTFQGLRERGFITTQMDSEGKERTKSLAWICGKPVRCYHFCISGIKNPPFQGMSDYE